MRKSSRISGFTMVEMAVVLTIIGLVISGIFIGRQLIVQSEIRAIIGEYGFYLKAVQEFQDKYQAMPGDMNNATSLWGTDSGGCPNTTYTSTLPTVTNTCNGNGDGMIASCTEDFSVACTAMPEIWRAWQHLSNAGLLEKKHTGIGQDVSGEQTGAVVGINAPKSLRAAAGWTLMHYSNPDDETWLSGGVYGHALMFGNGLPLTGIFTTYPALPPSNAFEIDRKIDNGLPKTGKIRAWENAWATGTTCISAGSGYDTCSGDTCVCGLIFLTNF